MDGDSGPWTAPCPKCVAGALPWWVVPPPGWNPSAAASRGWCPCFRLRTLDDPRPEAPAEWLESAIQHWWGLRVVRWGERSLVVTYRGKDRTLLPHSWFEELSPSRRDVDARRRDADVLMRKLLQSCDSLLACLDVMLS